MYQYKKTAGAGVNPKALQTHSPNTIDEKHSELLAQYHHNREVVLPQLMTEIESLKKTAKSLKDNQIEEYMDIRDKIIVKMAKIKEIKREKKRYLMDNSQYIFDYFEHKKDISTGGGKQNTDTLNTFFKIRTKTGEDGTIASDKYSASKKLYQNYWKNVNGDLVNIQDYVVAANICERCGRGELIHQDEEGIMICNNSKCGVFITYILDSSKPSNKEPPNEVSYTAYIRLNHFKEILSQFQAKETTRIPPEVIENIRQRIIKERITDMRLINYDKMREILRKLGYNKYFEHIQYINSIFGIKPPIMNEELHETLCVLFIEIQKPWAVHCPANRTNFFNYTYTLHQLCVLLDQTQYLPYIPMMKDREKQLDQDMIWKKVCNDLDWEFFPTV
jgi:Poxvirus Late Transcription Factor VLTF3 like